MTIFGWDASHYDGVPSGARVVSEGFAFMTHKAGGDANDAELNDWWTAVKGQRDSLLLGAYWVLRPDLTTSAATAADLFLARLDGQCAGWRDGPFILQADCEIWNGDSSTKPSRAYIKAFCDRLSAKMPKLTPIVYASSGQYGSALTGLGYPLWNARYVLSYQAGTASGLYASSGGDGGSGWGSYSGQVPAVWQFTSSATIAGQSTCDANAYRGTLADLVALVAPGWEIDMALTDADVAKVVAGIAAMQVPVGSDQWRADTAIGYAARKGYEIQSGLPAQLSSVTSGVAAVIPTAGQNAAAFLAALDVDSEQDIAEALKAVLGDKAAAVGALLQA